ncbi:MAG: SOS response-associated peptidase [Chloroflexi bacterium]|nr:SOS response-associated peptidase [Chloroflexota bacterium]
MCGRFALVASAQELADLFDLDDAPDPAPRYNIAPTQPVLAVRVSPETREREFALFRWGLIPSWAKDPGMSARMINARAETAAEKPAFRAAFRRRRCLIPATGFYEWRKQPGGKQPYFVTMQDDRPFAMAGLWEYWLGADGSEVASCTILTTQPNELVESLHTRMPVILPKTAFDEWLDPATPPDILRHLLRPYPAEEMLAYPVSRLVNNPANDGPECIEPLFRE